VGSYSINCLFLSVARSHRINSYLHFINIILFSTRSHIINAVEKAHLNETFFFGCPTMTTRTCYWVIPHVRNHTDCLRTNSRAEQNRCLCENILNESCNFLPVYCDPLPRVFCNKIVDSNQEPLTKCQMYEAKPLKQNTWNKVFINITLSFFLLLYFRLSSPFPLQ